MVCFTPLDAWRPVKSGEKKLIFSYDARLGISVKPDLQVPCGQCVGCRFERSRQWAVRCMHEAQMHDQNCFITLTYRDENVPEGRTLVKRDFQLFMKRLRFEFSDKVIRFYHCGEYGERFGRPHYHALLFGHDFDDKVLHSVKNGFRLYTSETLERLWPHGFCLIGDVTFESAAYVARYIMKKINGEMADEHYRFIDPETGEVFQRQPEYTTMSRRPGIGAEWFARYSGDVYPHDFVVVRGRKCRPPRYYDGLLKRHCEGTHWRNWIADFDEIKEARELKMNDPRVLDDSTPDRLKVREQCFIAGTLKRLPRTLD